MESVLFTSTKIYMSRNMSSKRLVMVMPIILYALLYICSSRSLCQLFGQHLGVHNIDALNGCFVCTCVYIHVAV